MTDAGMGAAVAALLLWVAPVLAVTTEPGSPIDTGTPIDIHCQSEPTSNVVIFYLTSDTSHGYGSELSCPTLGFRQLSPLDGYLVEIDKTRLAGDQSTMSLADVRNDPGYVGEAQVQWVTPTPPPSPVSETNTPPGSG